jgi:choline dehydrogenase-like flavoprotein
MTAAATSNIVVPESRGATLRLDCDVVVVGSGAGGATAAATLAEAGLDVLCLEEGGYHPTAEYSADIPQMIGKILRNGGATAIMGRSPVPYLEGRCVGGSTVVNGGMCWRTPERVLDTWVNEYRLEALSARRLEPHFEEVERTINARYQDPGSEGPNNDMFKRGADSLGWKLSKNRRNQIHCVGSNDCVTGCPTGAKQSTITTWLPRLYARGGAVYTHCRVEKILQEGGRVVGVAGRIVDLEGERRFVVRSRAVVLAGGAVQTPILMLRNGLQVKSGQVGRNFTIHPNVKMAALFDHPVAVRGAHQAWQCIEFEHEGILMAPGLIPLAFQSVAFNDFGPRLAQRMRDHEHIATGGILVDDHASGRVRVLPFGVPLVQYDVTDEDQRRFIQGAAYLATLYFEAGAREVYTPFHHFPRLRSADDIRRMKAAAPRVQDTEYFTAHLMGTCRMHGDSRQGALSPDGQVWDRPGLYVADAAAMPGTIGVNPQVTIMALARHIALHLGDRLKSRAAA